MEFLLTMTNQMDLQATWKAKIPVAIPAGKMLLFVYIHMITASTRGFKSFLTFTTPKNGIVEVSVMVVPVPHHTESMCTQSYNTLILVSMFIFLQIVYPELKYWTFSTNMNVLHSGSSTA